MGNTDISAGKILEKDLSRQALYGLVRENLQDLIVLSVHSSESKALGAIYYLLTFVQGKRRFPRKAELFHVVSDALDRNLGREAFVRKWHLILSQEPDVDNPEQYYLELQKKLQLIAEIREGWEGWQDG